MSVSTEEQTREACSPFKDENTRSFRMETAGFESLNYALGKSLSEARSKKFLKNCLKASTCFKFHSLGSLDTDLLASLWVDTITSGTLRY